jgi:hypothetical protein
MIECPCVYCRKEAKNAKSEYHIIPYSAGNIAHGLIEELTLPTGLVCDKCNGYFGQKIDRHLTGHPDVQLWRVLKNLRGRSKTLEYQGIKLKLSQHKNKILTVEESQDNELFISQSGKIKNKRPSLASVNHVGISRALHKIAFEYEIKSILEGIVAITMARYGFQGKKADKSVIFFEEESGVVTTFKTIGPPVIKTPAIINIEKHLYADPEVVKIAREQILSGAFDHIRNYVRQPQPKEYRPYGIGRGGGTGANVAAMSFKASDDPAIVGPTFNSYVIALPGVRFVVTTSQESTLLKYALNQITHNGLSSWMGATEIYWDAKGSMIRQ